LAPWAFAIAGALWGVNRHPTDQCRAVRRFALTVVVGGVALLHVVRDHDARRFFTAQDYRRCSASRRTPARLSKMSRRSIRADCAWVEPDYATAIVTKMLGDQAGLGLRSRIGAMQISQLNGCFEATVVGATAPSHVCFDRELVGVRFGALTASSAGRPITSRTITSSFPRLIGAKLLCARSATTRWRCVFI